MWRFHHRAGGPSPAWWFWGTSPWHPSEKQDLLTTGLTVQWHHEHTSKLKDILVWPYPSCLPLGTLRPHQAMGHNKLTVLRMQTNKHKSLLQCRTLFAYGHNMLIWPSLSAQTQMSLSCLCVPHLLTTALWELSLFRWGTPPLLLFLEPSELIWTFMSSQHEDVLSQLCLQDQIRG